MQPPFDKAKFAQWFNETTIAWGEDAAYAMMAGFFVGLAAAMEHPEWARAIHQYEQSQWPSKEGGSVGLAHDLVEAIPITKEVVR